MAPKVTEFRENNLIEEFPHLIQDISSKQLVLLKTSFSMYLLLLIQVNTGLLNICEKTKTKVELFSCWKYIYLIKFCTVKQEFSFKEFGVNLYLKCSSCPRYLVPRFSWPDQTRPPLRCRVLPVIKCRWASQMLWLLGTHKASVPRSVSLSLRQHQDHLTH